LACRAEVVRDRWPRLQQEAKTQAWEGQAAGQALAVETVRAAAFRVKGREQEKKEAGVDRIPMHVPGFLLIQVLVVPAPA
jgi:hypothetical protein